MNKHRGLTIIELMIGLAIGTIVLASAGALFVSTLRTNMDNVKQQRFEQSLQVLKGTIAAGIRRAGFSNSTTSLPDVSGWTSGKHFYITGACVLYTYIDTTFVTPKQQYFGYKLDTNTDTLYSYQSDSKVDCGTTSTWEAMTDPTQIKITEVTPNTLFTTPANPKVVNIRLIAEATGLTTGTSPVKREALVKVFVRND